MGLFSINSSEQQKKLDASPYLRRVVDLTTPNRMRADDKRNDSRYFRGLPIAVCRWDRKKPDVSTLNLGITRDISDNGVAILTTSELEFTEVVFTFLVGSEITSELWFFNATIVRKCNYFGFGEYGMQINEFLNENHRQQLQPLVHQLTSAPA